MKCDSGWSGMIRNALKTMERSVLGLVGRLTVAVLSLLGVMSGCGSVAEPSYGVPSVDVGGHVRSAADSIDLCGIEVRLVSTDSTTVYSTDVTGLDGHYGVWMDPPFPDSVRLIATDPDTSYGLFLEADSTLGLDEDGGSFEIDLYLQSAAE